MSVDLVVQDRSESDEWHHAEPQKLEYVCSSIEF